METIVFSSWGGTVIDNRGKAEAERVAAPWAKFPVEFRTGEPIRAFAGWDGLILIDESASPVALVRDYLEAVQEKASCGECFPCRTGTRIMADILGRIADGEGRADDLETLRSLAADVRDGSKCQIGQTAPIPVLHLLDHFDAELRASIGSGRPLPRSKTYSKVTAPCSDACPAHLDIPYYVETIKKMQYGESLARIRRDNVMPATCGRVCVRPCESSCRRANVDAPIAIKTLKRFVTDFETRHHVDPPYAPATPSQKKVAIVGAGPGGLACAFNLLQLGHACTLFEALPEPGGMAAVGIPDYRLPRDVIAGEVAILEALGAEFRYNTRLGTDFSLADMTGTMGFDAVFVAVGAHNSRKMGVEGEEAGYEGFVHGVYWLRDLNLGKPVFTADKLVCVGGGNVAIDVVRCALRKGFTDVNLVYRRSRAEMPADAEEIEDAEDEGIKFHFLTNPVRLIAENGKITGVECIRMELGEPDKSGRRRPVPVEGSEFVIETDAVIPAIGQIPDMGWVAEKDGLEITRWETIEADPITLQTAAPHVFTGGDCFTGPATLIGAIGAGNRAAIAIDKYLRGEPVEPTDSQLLDRVVQSVGVYDKDEVVGIVRGITRREMERLEPETRIHSFDEVEVGFTQVQAIAEAQRCLRCYRLAVVQV